MFGSYRRTTPLATVVLASATIAFLCLTASSAQALNTYHYAGGVIAPGGKVAAPSGSRHMVGNQAVFGGSGQSEVCHSVFAEGYFWGSPLIKECGLNGAGNALSVAVLYGQTIRAFVENPTSGHRLIHGYWYEDTSALWSQEVLGPGAERRSRNGKYRLVMQHDGNLVLYNNHSGKACWHTNSNGHPGNYARMQYDGNFVVYGAGVPQGGTPYYFATGTWNYPGWGLALHVQDDGNMILRASTFVPWTSGTAGC